MILFLMGVFEYPMWAINICGVPKKSKSMCSNLKMFLEMSPDCRCSNGLKFKKKIEYDPFQLFFIRCGHWRISLIFLEGKSRALEGSLLFRIAASLPRLIHLKLTFYSGPFLQKKYNWINSDETWFNGRHYKKPFYLGQWYLNTSI